MVDANKPFDISTATIDRITPIGVYCVLMIILVVTTFIALSISNRKKTSKREKVKDTSIFILVLVLIGAISYVAQDAFKERETLHTKEEFVEWAQQRYNVDVSSMPYKESKKETTLGLNNELGIEDNYSISTEKGTVTTAKIKYNKLILVDKEGSELPITNTESKEHDNVK